MMRTIIVKCTKRETNDTVNGPLTQVTLVPDGPLNTTTGSITLFVHDEEDLEKYQVGRFFRLTPDLIEA